MRQSEAERSEHIPTVARKAIVVLVEEIREDIKGESALKKCKQLASDFDFGRLDVKGF